MQTEFAKELNADRQLFLEMFKQVASSKRLSPRPILDLPGHITRLYFTKLNKKDIEK